MEFPIAFAYGLQVGSVVVVEKFVGGFGFLTLKDWKNIGSVDIAIAGKVHTSEAAEERQQIHAGQRYVGDLLRRNLAGPAKNSGDSMTAFQGAEFSASQRAG